MVYILSRATYHRAPSYGGVRTWVEGSQARDSRALAEASKLLGYKAYRPGGYLKYDCLSQACVN